MEPGQRVYREHHHTEFEISVFKSGKGTYTVGKKRYGFQKGDVFMFSSDEVHCITDISADEPFDLMNIHFEPRFIWSTGNDMFDLKYLKIFFERNDKFENRLERKCPTTEKIRNLLFEIEKEFEERQPEYELMIKVELLKILVTAIRGYDYVKTESHFSTKTQSVCPEFFSLDKCRHCVFANNTARSSVCHYFCHIYLTFSFFVLYLA